MAHHGTNSKHKDCSETVSVRTCYVPHFCPGRKREAPKDSETKGNLEGTGSS